MNDKGDLALCVLGLVGVSKGEMGFQTLSLSINFYCLSTDFSFIFLSYPLTNAKELQGQAVALLHFA